MKKNQIAKNQKKNIQKNNFLVCKKFISLFKSFALCENKDILSKTKQGRKSRINESGGGKESN